jgi:hypothetical protein
MRHVTLDLKNLIEEGIMYKGKLHAVRLLHLQGDGKERAAMFGMCDTFSAVSHCDPWSYLKRVTRINASSCREILSETQDKRTEESYKVDVGNIEGRIQHAKVLKGKKLKLKRLRKEAKAAEKAGGSRKRRGRPIVVAKLESKYFYSRGLKYSSVWNTIPYFHVAQQGALVPCTSHDLYAGAFRHDLARILVSLCNQGFFIWKDLQKNFRLKRLALKFEDKTNWHDQVCDKYTFKKLPGKHVSVHMIIRYASTFWMHREASDPMFGTTAWKMYLRMKKISELVTSKVFSKITLSNLRNHIEEYIDLKLRFKEENHDIKWLNDSCSPKHLWMLHYFNAVTVCGPLCQLETNIAESKNGQLRKHSTRANQTKNVLKTIFTRELRKSAVEEWTRKDNQATENQEAVILAQKISKRYRKALQKAGLQLHDFNVLKFVDKYGYRYRSMEEQVVAHDQQCFSELSYVLQHKRSKKLLMLVKPLEIDYKRHLGLYFVKNRGTPRAMVFKNLTSSKPLFLYEAITSEETRIKYFSLHESLPF